MQQNNLNQEEALSGSFIERFTTNLTQKARENRLDPVIGRDEEVRRVVQILSRRTKNNPVLIGDPGVGKTAIVEGLAQRIVSKDTPSALAEKELIVLDISTLIAGAKYRGEFEERIKGIVKEIEESGGKYIVFMDEIHTLIGAGAGEGAMDAGNILKPSLARGTLHAIGATTINEYRKYVEKDLALERRFQPVMVTEPTRDDSIAILRGLKERYEIHHGVKITDEALVSAVDLSIRYIPDRYLPDKAIDLIDEATSGLRMDIDSNPQDIDILKRKITQLEIEVQALKKENSPDAKQKKLQIEKNIESLKKEFNHKESIWKSQKEILKSIQSLNEQRDTLKGQAETAERNIELEKAAEIKFGKLPKVEEELKLAQNQWDKIPTEEKILRYEVTSKDIRSVVSRWTNIPILKLDESEKNKLINLEEQISKRIAGQKEAVSEVVQAIKRAKSGLSDENRPIASFLFLGPTGVGKTELTKSLAQSLFSNEKDMIRFDMTEFQERHSVARLIGAPPGYIGFEEGGQLTEAVRRKPFSILLFDEIEKAHKDVFNLFLQIMEDGHLTDGKNRRVNFKNTIIIMTSNLGSDIISQKQKNIEPKLWNLLKSEFRPEFLNRIDKIIVFDPLTKEDLLKIVDIQLELLSQRMAKQGLKLSVDKKSKEIIANEGFDPVFGARPVKRLIQEKITDPISSLMVKSLVKIGNTVQVTTNEKDEFVINFKE